jgi:hypothetical protein
MNENDKHDIPFPEIKTLADLQRLRRQTEERFAIEVLNIIERLRGLDASKREDERHKLKRAERRLVEEIFLGFGANDANRFRLFWENRTGFSGPQYWYALRQSYASSDNLYRFRKEVKRAFAANLPGREYLMNARERRMLSKLPVEVKIYRAMSVNEAKSHYYGVSWTLSKKVAEFFRDKYPRNYDTSHLEKVIKEKTVRRDRIIAIFDHRKEKEVLYLSR